MRGQERIIATRMTGKTPAWIWVDDYDPTMGFQDIGMDHVMLEAGDQIELQDWRFARLLRVLASSPSRRRAEALLGALKAAGAAFVAVSHYTQPENSPYIKTDWMEVWENVDGVWTKKAEHADH